MPDPNDENLEGQEEESPNLPPPDVGPEWAYAPKSSAPKIKEIHPLLLISIVTAIMFGFCLGCAGLIRIQEKVTERIQGPVTEELEDTIVVSGLESKTENGQTYLSGIAKNESKKKVSEIQIAIQVADKEDDFVGTVYIEISSLNPNQEETFREELPFEGAEKFSVYTINGKAQ